MSSASTPVRPGMLVKEASKFASKIMIASPKKEVDAKRIMGVMSMGHKEGRPP